MKLIKKITILNTLILMFAVFLTCGVSAKRITQAKIAIIGEYGSGKTALMCNLLEVGVDYENRSVTAESSFYDFTEGIMLNPDTKVFYQVWDTPGNKAVIEHVMEERVTDADVVMIVIDVTAGDMVDIATRTFYEWIPKIRKHNTRNASILIVFNKIDLLSGEYIGEISSRCSEVIACIGTRDMPIKFIFTSSKDDYCVSDEGRRLDGDVRDNILETFRVLLMNQSGKLRLRPSKAKRAEGLDDLDSGNCVKCGKRVRKTVLKNGKCRDCRKYVCERNGCSDYWYEGEPRTYVCKSGHTYCSEACAERDRYSNCSECHNRVLTAKLINGKCEGCRRAYQGGYDQAYRELAHALGECVLL